MFNVTYVYVGKTLYPSNVRFSVCPRYAYYIILYNMIYPLFFFFCLFIVFKLFQHNITYWYKFNKWFRLRFIQDDSPSMAIPFFFSNNVILKNLIFGVFKYNIKDHRLHIIEIFSVLLNNNILPSLNIMTY